MTMPGRPPHGEGSVTFLETGEVWGARTGGIRVTGVNSPGIEQA
jgi:hypothetical protein